MTKLYYYLNEYEQPVRIRHINKPNPNRPTKIGKWEQEAWFEIADKWSFDAYICKYELAKLKYIGTM